MRAVFPASFKLLRPHAAIWLLALLAVCGEIFAVLRFSPFTTRLTLGVLFFALLSLIAESAIIYLILQRQHGKETGFVDAFMTSLTQLGQLFGVKAVLFIPLALLAVVVLILLAIVRNSVVEVGLLILVGALLLVLMQVLSVFAIAYTFEQVSVGDALTFAWQHVREKRAVIVPALLPLFLLDLVLLAVAFGTGLVNLDDALSYTVEEQLPAVNPEAQSEGFEPVELFSFNRPVAGFIASGAGARGPHLFGIPFFMTGNRIMLAVALLVQLPLVLIRVGATTLLYLHVRDPDIVADIDSRSGP